jgi:bla regulator protein BlaR1
VAALIEIGLLNAPVALCLAGIVLLIGRLWKQPALLHALWVLVLLKLLMPPLIQIPVAWELPGWMDASTTSTAEFAAASGGFRSDKFQADPLQVGDQQNKSRLNAAHQHLSLSHGKQSHSASAWQPVLAAGWQVAQSAFVVTLFIWAVGSVIWFCSEGWRIVRFAQVFLRYARLAPKPMQRHASCLARDMGIKRCPEVWLLSAVVSPMLWCVGGKARILFPSQLATQLDKGALATLLTHELAHYYRGDHWVRMLEFVVTGLFWWHPAVWIARREIEIHEEQCCDAWVVSQFPKAPRQYANALLAAIDFLSEGQTALPAAASGLGDVPLIRQRLILIMRGAAPKSLGFMGKIIVMTVALLIPIQPRLILKSSLPVVEVSQSTTATPSHGATPDPRQKSKPPASPLRVKEFDGTKSKSTGNRHLSHRQSNPAAIATRSAVRTKAKFSLKKYAEVTQADWLVWAKAIAPNMLSRVIAHDDGKILWQHFGSKITEDLSSFEISTVAFTPEGQVFVAGCRDGSIRIWDATNGQLLKTLTGHQSDVRTVAIAPQGGWLVSGDQKGEVRLWSVLKDWSSEILSNYCAPISSVAFSDDGTMIAVATGARTENLRNTQRKQAGATLTAQTFAATDRGLIALWNLSENISDRIEIKQIETDSPLAVVVFSEDSRHISGAAAAGRVFTWNVASSELMGTTFADRKVIAAAAFTSDGRTIRAGIGPMFDSANGKN